ncbi:hypothetical protein P152DRAFT_515192 [Eremomyces bilateralis CBS 781.70]|uniref:Uncharacterized protein n=1 Tax=Eremomyces bilateralis CBS 781.70 TaxID=1392243 RepID=A0A6G1FZU7_9PEZI|nr:uncharacterized protein P152DRAFT_515192 [Eremomyces bilateralis CBS 781.70]KAF1811201.1 hypothetical protein P152DRAFT_515192 [Eremomyces bilateralis CBS 781.70]
MSPSTPRRQFLQPRAPRGSPRTHARPSESSASQSPSRPLEATEPFDDRATRERAAKYLESNEVLIWWSAQRNESLAQTVRYFEGVVAGAGGGGEAVLWEDEYVPDEEDRRRLDPRTYERGEGKQAGGGAEGGGRGDAEFVADESGEGGEDGEEGDRMEWDV